MLAEAGRINHASFSPSRGKDEMSLQGMWNEFWETLSPDRYNRNAPRNLLRLPVLHVKTRCHRGRPQDHRRETSWISKSVRFTRKMRSLQRIPELNLQRRPSPRRMPNLPQSAPVQRQKTVKAVSFQVMPFPLLTLKEISTSDHLQVSLLNDCPNSKTHLKGAVG